MEAAARDSPVEGCEMKDIPANRTKSMGADTKTDTKCHAFHESNASDEDKSSVCPLSTCILRMS